MCSAVLKNGVATCINEGLFSLFNISLALLYRFLLYDTDRSQSYYVADIQISILINK